MSSNNYIWIKNMIKCIRYPIRNDDLELNLKGLSFRIRRNMDVVLLSEFSRKSILLIRLIGT